MCLLECHRLPSTLVDPCVHAGLLAGEEAAVCWCGLISHPAQPSPRPSLTHPPPLGLTVLNLPEFSFSLSVSHMDVQNACGMLTIHKLLPFQFSCCCVLRLGEIVSAMNR